MTFRADASYLITGGLGGFGLAVARWMAERGAGTLVLMGRRGAETPEAREAVAELERLGARVVVHAGRCVAGSRRRRGAGRDRPRPAAAPRRAARGDGPGGCPAGQPGPRPDGAGAGPEAGRDLEPARADRRPAARFLRHVLVVVERIRPRGAGELRGGERLPRRHGLVSPRHRPARADDQLGPPRRGRLPRPSIRAGRAAGAAGCPELHRPRRRWRCSRRPCSGSTSRSA